MLVTCGTYTEAHITHAQYSRCINISIYQLVIYIGTHIRCLACNADMMCLTDKICLGKALDRGIIISKITCIVNMTANYRLRDIKGIDSPHHVSICRCGRKADTGVILNKGHICLYIIMHILAHFQLPAVGGGTRHTETSVHHTAA